MGSIDGWVAVALVAVVVVVIARRRALASVLFSMEDPRTLAAMRIVTGTLLIAYVAGREPLDGYLLTDEGLFPTEVAQQVFASGGFVGYGWPHEPGSPAGFFDLRGVLRWVFSTNHSLLLFRSDPAFVYAHQVAFHLACGAFTIGLFTRFTKWITWFLLLSMLGRSAISFAGEHVFLGSLVPLCWSRCDAAWSVDRWLRRDAPARVPAWPRWIMILQTLPMWTANGLHKHGRDWADGDALWFSLQHPLLRYPWATGLADVLGPWPLRLATWFVHAFELAFPLVVIGVVWSAFADAPAPGRRERVVARGGALLLAVAIVALSWLGFSEDARGRSPFFAAHGYAVLLVFAIIGRPRLPARMRPWIFGRRVWLVAAVAFTLPLNVMFNFGPFTIMAVATCLVFVRGEEIDWFVRRVAAFVGWRYAARPGSIAAPALPRRRRIAIAVLVSAHVLAVAFAILPRDPSPHPVRARADEASRTWIRFWGTTQHWQMFAPNGPRSIDAVRVDVTLADGSVHDVGYGFDADRDFALSTARDKGLKIARRLAGEGDATWYRKWHARYVCRAWALRHDGRVPDRVTLWLQSTPIAPPPDRPAYDRQPIARELHVSACADEPHGQPSPEILRRHGLDPIAATPYLPWIVPRWDAWRR